MGVTAELRAGRSRGEWERDRGDVFRATKSRKLLGDPELTKFSRVVIGKLSVCWVAFSLLKRGFQMQNDMFFFLIALVKKRSVKKLGKTHVDSVES